MAEAAHLSEMEIQSLLDGAMDGPAVQGARVHLAGCARCSSLLASQARVFARIESWKEVTPPRDLTPAVLAALQPSSTPAGLRWAAAVQAGTVLFILGVAWPLLSVLLQNLRLPMLWSSTVRAAETQVFEGAAFAGAIGESLVALLNSVTSWIQHAPGGMAVWPGIVAAAAILAVAGNSFLLSGNSPAMPSRQARRH